MTCKIFIDGEAGTTGLQIRQRLESRDDLSLLHLQESERKKQKYRKDALNSADVVILCLPDDAARDAVSMIENDAVRVIDASTAHRTSPGWVYGMAEYDSTQAEKIATAFRLTNPGCYALVSVAILHPLVKNGIIPGDYPVSINAISGYSGGGKKLIAAFENPEDADYSEDAFRVYGLSLEHKHIAEIQLWSGLSVAPLFVPGVGRFRQGMIVQIPLHLKTLPGTPSLGKLHDCLMEHYDGQQAVTVKALSETSVMSSLQPEFLNDTNELHLHVFGNDKTAQAVIIGVIDNLGKGASGQVMQNLDLMLG